MSRAIATIFLPIIFAIMLLSACGSWRDDDITGFPSIHITSENDPFTQERTFWHDGTVSLTGAGRRFDFEDAEIRIRGRGNSSWQIGQDKRPLRFRFSQARPVMSNYDARDWILLADQFDRSLLRNYTALSLGLLLDGLSFTPVPHHVHLYVNGEYMGVYLLTDERNVGPGRMNIIWDEDPAHSGFFLERDVRAPMTGILNETFVSVTGQFYDLRYPSNLSPQHVEYVIDYLTAVSYAIRNQSFNDVLTLIDLDSFVDFYIVQEFTKDIDAKDLSIFMYITGSGNERRLFKGPIWDYDLAMGNASNQLTGYGPEDLYVAVFNYWYRYLMNMPEFFDAVKTRWNEIRHNEIAQVIECTRITATRYQHEFERNFERHPDVMGRQQMPTPQEIFEIDYFMGHVEHLLSWLEDRANWLDDFFNGRLPDYDHTWAFTEYKRNISPVSIIANGRPHVANIYPISVFRQVFIALEELEAIFGFQIEYDLSPSETIMMQQGNINIMHQVGGLYLTIGDKVINFTSHEIIEMGDYIFVPLLSFVEALGYEVGWDEQALSFVIDFEN